MIELRHFKISNDIMLLGMDSQFRQIRKANIKFYNRLNRVASKYNLTNDELYTIWSKCIRAMNSKDFFRLFVQNDKFRDTMINRVLRDEDV